MTSHAVENHWDPRCAEVQKDQLAAYDNMRGTCPIAHSEYMNWSVFTHADVKRILRDHETFSSRVSNHLSVPNGMDPPEHEQFRAIIDKYFAASKMDRFEPVARSIAAELVASLPTGQDIEVMEDIAQIFSLRCQSAFMGWPISLERPLLEWVRKNHAATLECDPVKLEAVACDFDHHIRNLLTECRGRPPEDITGQLLNETVEGRPLSEEEIVSIIRNWTVGELSTIASSVGIVLKFLAEHSEVQDHLSGDYSQIDTATDEIQRIHDPLVTSRRVATKTGEISGQKFGAGTRFTIMWPSANRDEAVFDDPDQFRLDRDHDENFVYGAGIHACPGATLARLELRVLLEELFGSGARILSTPDKHRNAIYPAGGYSEIYIRMSR